MNKKKASPWKSIKVGLIALLVLVIYSYGFQVTKVDLEELQNEQRQTSLQRVMRALARPDIIYYAKDEIIINSPIYVPCPLSGIPETEPFNKSEPYVVTTPSCAQPGEVIIVEGFNFTPNATGPVRFVPGNDPENIVTLGRDNATTDENGNFSLELTMPKRPSEEVQFVRTSMRSNKGLPMVSQTAKDTWNKIIETVFLALLATTFGTVLAVPLSFIAAKNLMKPVKSPLASISLSILGWPIGFYVGLKAVQWIGNISNQLQANFLLKTLLIVAIPVLIIRALRWAIPPEETDLPSSRIKIGRFLVILICIIGGVFVFYQLADWVSIAGSSVAKLFGTFAFLGTFFFQVSAILRILVPLIGGLIAGGFLAGKLGQIGQKASEKLPSTGVKCMNIFLAAAAGATILVLLGLLVESIYQIGNTLYTIWIPGIVGAILGIILALINKAKATLPIGLVIYSVSRSFLNGLRSIEALVMAIVFVIAVGIGPFAGVLALGLHTIVSLAKLYSEQVESIMPGPMEAVEATGANRLQTIIYAVIPQIIPPYISYTMYRWDINVRMSTIIGFVGGGGIGFLLQQNINLLNYRGASTQMIAIAIVVASMDYVSSVLREKYV